MLACDMPNEPAPTQRIHQFPLPYEQRLQARETAQIDLVVVHCTELPDLAMAREYGERALYADGTGNSGHYYIDRDGSIQQFVACNRVAHHTRGYNPRSIGIELVNRGRYPDWLDSRQQEMREPYPDAQIDALIALLADLRANLPGLTCVAGHEDLDIDEVPATDDPTLTVRRKRDPGSQFPWTRVLSACGLQRVFAGSK